MTAPTPSLREAAQMALDALAVPEPEPVARVVSWTNGSYSRNYKVDWLKNVAEGAELYAEPRPAPIERQPLTDDQIEDMRGDANRGSNIGREDYFKAVRDAEAAHGIRGAA